VDAVQLAFLVGAALFVGTWLGQKERSGDLRYGRKRHLAPVIRGGRWLVTPSRKDRPVVHGLKWAFIVVLVLVVWLLIAPLNAIFGQ
jgi:hypothetical protein